MCTHKAPWPRFFRSQPPATSPSPLVHHHRLLFLHFLSFSCVMGLAVLSPAGASPEQPELDRTVDTITCSPAGCATATLGPATASSHSSLCTTPNTVLLYDDVACFLAATAYAGYRPFDLGKGSGGEVIFCRQVLNLLNLTGHTFLVSKSIPALESCVMAGRAQGLEHVLFVHGAWWNLKGEEMLGNAFRIRPPFREDCLVSLTLWGTPRPFILWPGDLRYYVTSFPYPDNPYVLQAKPTQCPTFPAFNPVRLPTYGVLFEKFKVMPWKVNQTDPFSHNATLWTELQRRVHLVVLDCSDALAAKLGWPADFRERVTCWKDSPLSQQYSYHDLLRGAAFFLGLGATGQSPTPVELNYCRTPIIMPPYQHTFVRKYAGPQEYYPVTTADGVLRAVDAVLANCKVSFMKENGAVTKKSSCFQEPPSLDAPLNITILAEDFAKLMRARKVLCFTQPRKALPPAPAPVAYVAGKGGNTLGR